MATQIVSSPQKAAIYARVSTANNGQDPRLQTRELQEYCERRGWVIGGEYQDTITGSRATARAGSPEGGLSQASGRCCCGLPI